MEIPQAAVLAMLSGYSGDVLLDDKFAANNHLGDKLPITGVKHLKDAFGNIVKTKRVLLPAFAVGGSVLTNVPAVFLRVP